MTLLNSDAALDQLCIDTLRFLAVDMVQKANSGHPGLPLGAAPMAYALWTRFLKHNPTQSETGSTATASCCPPATAPMLLYALLHLTGYDVALDEIKRFRQWDSTTPGHPERGQTPGVEITTGPLGQGFANAVGMAIAEASSRRRSYNRPGFDIVDHTYLRDRERRRPDGGRRLRGRLARRPSAARQVGLPLRRQPCHAIGGHRRRLY